MTTIAYDGRYLVADGKATKGETIVSLCEKKISLRHGRVYALAGVHALTDAVVEWHNKGADPNDPPKCSGGDNGWVLIVIDKDGCREYHNDVPYPDTVDAPCAWGSGRGMARGIMYYGASALDAVKVCCERDINSGGEIQVIDIAEALGLDKLLLEAAE